jgi:hypothetical protein
MQSLFARDLGKVKTSCEVYGHPVRGHFAGIGKMVDMVPATNKNSNPLTIPKVFNCLRYLSGFSKLRKARVIYGIIRARYVKCDGGKSVYKSTLLYIYPGPYV